MSKNESKHKLVTKKQERKEKKCVPTSMDEHICLEIAVQGELMSAEST
jgi:hypothetical protein